MHEVCQPNASALMDKCSFQLTLVVVVMVSSGSKDILTMSCLFSFLTGLVFLSGFRFGAIFLNLRSILASSGIFLFAGLIDGPILSTEVEVVYWSASIKCLSPAFDSKLTFFMEGKIGSSFFGILNIM